MMNTTVSILCNPDAADNPEFIRTAIINQLHLKDATPFCYRLIRRSVDARSRIPNFVLDFFVAVDEPLPVNPYTWSLNSPSRLAGKIIIVGAGPAGYFAALRLLENGIKPVVLERGKDVLERRKDIQPLLKRGIIHPDSNYCFGEGGAGAYSDGKLYTRSHKRGDVQQILAILSAHGASPDILIDSHPHVGSNRLPRIVKNLRETIISHGGEIHFNSKVTDFIINNQTIAGVTVNDCDTV
ncbi:MAG: FAD-dependent monooxygenase, partial [Desulfatirhabdiaceae bacterium]